jgi:hypothetical protein
MERMPLQKKEKLPSGLKILIERFVLAGAITFGIFGIGSSLYEVASTKEGPRIESSIKSEGSEIKEGELRAILNTYPESWIKHISSIRQNEAELEELSPLDRYGIEGYTTGAIVRMSSFGKYRLLLSDTFAHLKTREMTETLSHEIGHTGFNPELFDKILIRLGAEDRFRSEYVESIINPDEGTETVLRINEYWAEICKQYFEDAGKLNSKDRRIVEERIKKENPSFDWQKARDERNGLIAASKQREQEERRESLGLGDISVLDEAKDGRLILNFDFILKGLHFKIDLEEDAKFLGQRGRIFHRANGFVYSREIKTNGRSEFLSFFFSPKGNTITVSETRTMREIKKVEAIS